jgi:hypothetical protein
LRHFQDVVAHMIRQLAGDMLASCEPLDAGTDIGNIGDGSGWGYTDDSSCTDSCAGCSTGCCFDRSSTDLEPKYTSAKLQTQVAVP